MSLVTCGVLTPSGLLASFGPFLGSPDRLWVTLGQLRGFDSKVTLEPLLTSFSVFWASLGFFWCLSLDLSKT